MDVANGVSFFVFNQGNGTGERERESLREGKKLFFESNIINCDLDKIIYIRSIRIEIIVSYRVRTYEERNREKFQLKLEK